MPQLKQLSCCIQWPGSSAPFSEHGTVYGDGLVETFVAVPNKPQPFTIRLKSLNFIYEGLSVIVFIDGQYQANRNRVNLKPKRKGMPLNRSQIDFLLRQREKSIGDGVYMGREWRFDNHNIVENLPEGVKESHFDMLGMIEVFVLRCRARWPEAVNESGSSSAADSDALEEKGERVILDEEVEQDLRKVSNKDGIADDDDAQREQSQRLGTDGANDPRFNPNGLPSMLPGHAGPPPWLPLNTPHATHASRGQYGSARSATYQQVHNAAAQPTHSQQSYNNSRARHVHFNVDAQPTPSAPPPPPRPPPPPPVPPKPPSYERNDRPASRITSHHSQPHSVPQLQAPQTTFGQGYPPLGSGPYGQFNVHVPQQPHMIPSSSYLGPQPASVPVFAQPLPVTHQYPSYRAYQPQLLSNNATPYHAPFHPSQPPQFFYNPYAQWSSQSVPYGPHPDFSPTAEAQSHKDSNSGVGNQQQNTTPEQNQISNGGNNAWKDWSNPGTNVTANEGQAYNSQYSSTNDKVQWSGDLNPNTQLNDPIQAWNTFDNAGGNNEVDDYHNNNDNQNDGNDNGDLNNADNNDGWENNEDNKNGDSEQGWGDDAHDSAVNDTAANDTQDPTTVARALFGPHGQYYTYYPKGPDEPTADVEEEPRYDVPKKIVDTTGSTKQVVPGSGYMYWKKRCAPEYIDSLEEPYARFVFKYRTKDQLEKEIGVKIEVEPTGDEAIQKLQVMDKQALIEMLIRAKSALGGKVPSPPLKPTSITSDKSIPVPVEPPDQDFLRYRLPEFRKQARPHKSRNDKAKDRSDATRKAGGVESNWTAGNERQSWETSANNNDTTWTLPNQRKSDWATENTISGNINWHRGGDGTGEKKKRRDQRHQDSPNPPLHGQQASPLQPQTGGQLHDLSGANDQAQHLAQNTGVDSYHSSPATLPLDQPFNSTSSDVPPRPPTPPPPPVEDQNQGYTGWQDDNQVAGDQRQW